MWRASRRFIVLRSAVVNPSKSVKALCDGSKGRGEVRGRRREHACDGDIVIGGGDEAEIGENVLDEGVLEDGEPRNHKGNLAASKLAHEVVAMIMRAVEHCEFAPAAAGFVDALELVGNPACFVLRYGELHDANFLAFRFAGGKQFLGEIGADRVLANHLRRDAQNVGGGAIVLSEADAELRGILAFAPAGKAFQEKLEAAERSAAKAVDGLIIVADRENVFGIVDEQLEQTQLGDIGILKLSTRM